MNEHLTLLHWLNSLGRYGDRPAVLALDKKEINKTSYQQLDDLSRRFAAGLQQRDVGRGNLVALLAPSSPSWIAACLGILRAGATPVPLNLQYDDEALLHVLDDCRPRLVLTDESSDARLAELDWDQSPEVYLLDRQDGQQSWHRLCADEPEELPAAAPADEAILLYTSGTTGPPKGVPLSHENISAQIEVLLDVDLVQDEDRVILPLPLHHVYPLVIGLLMPLARGLSIVLPYSLTGPQMVRALNETKVTIVIGVPRLYQALYDGMREKVESGAWVSRVLIRSAMTVSMWLRRRWGVRAGKWLLRPLHRQFGPRLRVAACGGSPLDDQLAWNLEALGWQVAIGYGLTETSPLLAFKSPRETKMGTVGKTIPNIELRIDDSDDKTGGKVNGSTVGEILARGPSVFSGYRNLPDKTHEVLTEDGWFRTGDLGYIDEQGDLHVTGRKGTVIVTEAGENVQPDDVERVYAEHAAIREVGVLDNDGRLVALIVPETSELDEDDLQKSIAQAVETCGRQLPSYQRIGDFHLTRESLPRTRLGKIRRHKLRERFAQAAKGEDESDEQPIPVDAMTSHDRALLNEPAAKRIWDLLAEKYADRRLSPDTNMRLDLGVDSLEWMNLSLAIRRRAGVEIDDGAIGRIETARDLLRESSEAATTGERFADSSPFDDPLATLSEDQRQYLKPHGRFASLLTRSIFAINRILIKSLFRLEVQGADDMPDGPILIAPNHVSYLDALVVAAALPWQRLRQTYWGGWTGTLFTSIAMRWFSRLTHVVPIDPQRGALSSLAFGKAVLNRNQHLVWFPEGQRSSDGQLQNFRAGIGLLLKHSSARVVPTAIAGTYRALAPGHWLPRPTKVRVMFGQPLDADKLADNADDGSDHERIAQRLQDAVASLLDRNE